MQDRVSLYPGRVTLTPVAGQANTYDMVRADQPTQEGTPLNKASLLTDATAALYGLGTDAVPNDVFGWVGKYAEYWWSLLHGQASSYWAESLTPLPGSVTIYQYGATISYSYSISISNSGVASLNNPQTITIASSSGETAIKNYCSQLVNLAANAPYYMSFTNGTGIANTNIYKVPEGATAGTTSNASNNTFYFTKIDSADFWISFGTGSWAASVVSATLVDVPAGGLTYAHSIDRNEYPDSGTVDGVTYTYLGIPFEKLPTAPKIATGQYTGGGVYGNSNKNSLTFDFEPKFVRIAHSTGAAYTSTWIFNIGYAYSNAAKSGATYSLNGKTLSWYSTNSANDQLNTGGAIYYYFAIG